MASDEARLSMNGSRVVSHGMLGRHVVSRNLLDVLDVLAAVHRDEQTGPHAVGRILQASARQILLRVPTTLHADELAQRLRAAGRHHLTRWLWRCATGL